MSLRGVRVEGRALRLTDADFQQLVEGDASPRGQEALGVQEALDVQRALSVPGVPEALEAVRSPVAVLDLAVAGRGHLMSHQGWIGHDTVALLLDVHDEERQLMTLPPALLASGLARLLRLGPRKVGERTPRGVDAALLADLFAETEILRRSAFDTLGVEVAWNLGLSWPGGDRWLSGVDGRGAPPGAGAADEVSSASRRSGGGTGDRSGGFWLVAGGEDDPRLEPTTATDLWRLLTTLLLGIDEASPQNMHSGT